MRRTLLLLALLALGLSARAQASYIVEQLGRDAHQIVQSLGAFVGNERAESQSFDITYMPAGNRVEGVMIINTADYRCTFKMDPMAEECYEIRLDIRNSDFLREFNTLFQIYKTQNPDGDIKIMQFGDFPVRVEEVKSNTSRGRAFLITKA